MINKAIALYTIIDDLLKGIGHKQDPRAKMSDSEVITTMLIAAMEFGGNFKKAMDFMKQTGLIPNMLSKSRFCRRAHALAELVSQIFLQLGMVLKQANISMQYIIDSFPVAICDNIRINRCRIVSGEEFRGYIPSKRRYFYGVRIHMITTADGIPVEFVFMPGGRHDINALYLLPLQLPPGSEILADKAYNDYEIEDDLWMMDQIKLSPLRRKNSKRWQSNPWIRLYERMTRRRIETVFSEIVGWFPRKIHAVTFDGFLLKLVSFIFAFTMCKAFSL